MTTLELCHEIFNVYVVYRLRPSLSENSGEPINYQSVVHGKYHSSIAVHSKVLSHSFG